MLFRAEGKRVKISFRRGVALADLVVTMACVLGLFVLGSPALLIAVEGSRETSCKKNLSDLHSAVMAFEVAQSSLPRSQYRPAFGDPIVGEYQYWPVKILPFLEEAAAFEAYDSSANPWGDANNKLANRSLSVFTCPSDPTRGTAAIFKEPGIADTDNKGVIGCYTLTDWTQSTSGPVGDERGTGALCPWIIGQQPLISRPVTRALITDGMTHTLLFTENSAPSQHWVRGKLVSKDFNPGGMWRAQWIGNRRLTPSTFSEDGTEFLSYTKGGMGPCAVNCANHNWAGVYSFHPRGVNAVMMDGSVRFLSESLDGAVLFAMVSRAGGEVLSVEDYQ